MILFFNPIRLLLTGLSLGLLAGCATMGSSVADNKLVIPDYPTAQEQYQFARVYQAGLIISPDSKRRKDQMHKTIQYYDKVLANFPDDQSCCPRASLEIGDCYVQANEMNKAMQQYNQARDRYPSDEYVQARSRYSVARTLDMQHKYAEAKVLYKEIMDNYSQSSSAAVRDVVNRARQLYFQVKEAPKKKAKA